MSYGTADPAQPAVLAGGDFVLCPYAFLAHPSALLWPEKGFAPMRLLPVIVLLAIASPAPLWCLRTELYACELSENAKKIVGTDTLEWRLQTFGIEKTLKTDREYLDGFLKDQANAKWEEPTDACLVEMEISRLRSEIARLDPMSGQHNR